MNSAEIQRFRVSLSKVLQNALLGACCNTFDLHKATIYLESQFSVFLRVTVLHRFYKLRSFNCGTEVLQGAL